jgi:hypothetical protein
VLRLARRRSPRSQESARRCGYKSPDCPVSLQRTRPSTSATNSLLSGKGDCVAAKNHPTVRWCTGLSGEPTAPAANGHLCDQRAIRGRAKGRIVTPNCPACTGLSGVHRTVRRALDSVRCTNGSEDPRSASPEKERDRVSHPVLEGKPNANHVRARISNSRTKQLHNVDIITQCSNSIKRGNNSRLHRTSETSIWSLQ